MIRKMAGTLSMSFLIAGCAPMGVYQPPASAQLQKFTRDMNGSYDGNTGQLILGIPSGS